MSLLLGIDLGTSSVKALVLDLDGRTTGRRSVPIAVHRPHPGWAEQRPQEWLDAASEAVHGVLEDAGGRVVAIGCSGQMNGPVLIPTEGPPTAPVQLWCDLRCSDQVREIHAAISREELIRATGKPAAAGYTAPKLLWELARGVAIHRWVLPKDVLVHALAGVWGTDPSDAANTLLFDLDSRSWNEERAARLGIDPASLVPVHPSAAVVGTTAGGWAGLPEGISVVAGGGDTPCGVLGGGVESGRVQLVLGSAGNVNAVGDVVDAAGRVHTGLHVLPGESILTGVQQAAGAALRWWSEVCGRSERELLDELDGPPVGVLFAPYLSGDRTPHLDSAVRGGFVDLSASTTRAHMTAAVLEGVAFAMRDALEVFAELGVPVGSLILAGGGARHPAWRRALADGVGADLLFRPEDAGWETARGAALLAGQGVGVDPPPPSAAESTHPRSDSSARYARWRRTYPMLGAFARPPKERP
jgi:xylulokinase